MAAEAPRVAASGRTKAPLPPNSLAALCQIAHPPQVPRRGGRFEIAAVDTEVGPSPHRGRAQRVGTRQAPWLPPARRVYCRGFSEELQFLCIDGHLDFLRSRHLRRGVVDEQRHSADEDDHPAQPQPAVGVAVVQRV
jgi:hypothetical protein